jgi:hypothetical protein
LPVQILNHQRRRRLVARILEIVCVFDQVEDDKHARTRRLGYGFRSDWVMWLGEKREPVRFVVLVHIQNLDRGRCLQKRPYQAVG